jgi:hypothetical protein
MFSAPIEVEHDLAVSIRCGRVEVQLAPLLGEIAACRITELHSPPVLTFRHGERMLHATGLERDLAVGRHRHELHSASCCERVTNPTSGNTSPSRRGVNVIEGSPRLLGEPCGWFRLGGGGLLW